MSNNLKLTIQDGTFSTAQDLFIFFSHDGTNYHTMCKDGEGRHAIWDQKFDLKFSEG